MNNSVETDFERPTNTALHTFTLRTTGRNQPDREMSHAFGHVRTRGREGGDGLALMGRCSSLLWFCSPALLLLGCLYSLQGDRVHMNVYFVETGMPYASPLFPHSHQYSAAQCNHSSNRGRIYSGLEFFAQRFEH